MVLSRDDYLARVRERIGESTEDADIAFLEDMTDTYEDLYKMTRDNVDWQTKYNELDASWRKRYIDRFDEKVQSDPNIEEVNNFGVSTPKTFDELFK